MSEAGTDHLTQARVSARLTVIILTYNEELHLARAIASVRGIADQIIVVDSFSTDATVAIAHEHGAEVLQHAFVNQAKQFNWALETAAIDGEWIFRLDADEIIEPDLRDRIAATLPTLALNIVGINLDRKHVFLGRWIRHGGRYPVRLLRIWRRDHGRVEDRWMDEHVVTWGGQTITLKGGFADHNLGDLSYFTEKHNKYASREAVQVLLARIGLRNDGECVSAEGVSRQASFRRWMKERVYNRLPFWISSSGYFLLRYVAQLGFLDGRAGLIYHFLQGGWYRFLVGAKIYEFELALKDETTVDAKRSVLARLSGLPLGSIERVGREPKPNPIAVSGSQARIRAN